MTTYSEETLRKINKDKLIDITLSLQSKMEADNTNVLVELKPLKEKFSNLEADVAYSA